MKKNFFIKSMVVLAFMTLSCQKDNNGMLSAKIQVEIQQVTNLVTIGSWHITSFVESGNDHTSDFNGYGFSFNENGSLIADNGSDTANGTWSITDSSSNNGYDDSGNDISSEDIDFEIFFAAPPQFNNLSEDWNIVSRSETLISLIHVSGGNGGTDTLTFEKN